MNTKKLEKEIEEIILEWFGGKDFFNEGELEQITAQLISKVKEAREETIKEVLKMLPKEKSHKNQLDEEMGISRFEEGYNQAIKDIKNKIDTKYE